MSPRPSMAAVTGAPADVGVTTAPAQVALRACAAPRCDRSFLPHGRHRHCCQDCRLGVGHSRRCNRQQRLLFRSSGLGFNVCNMPGCGLSSSGDHDTCCSTCRPSRGALHTRRCRGQLAIGGTSAPRRAASSTMDFSTRTGISSGRDYWS